LPKQAAPLLTRRREDPFYFKECVTVSSQLSAAQSSTNYWVWGDRASKPRFLHTMIRVKDFNKSLHFYVDGLGMKMLDRYEVEVRRTSAIFIGFDGYAAGGCVELVKPWDDKGPHEHGNAYGHFAIGVPDVPAMLAKLQGMGVEVTVRPQVLIGDGPQVAFVKDPDGYDVELIQTRRG
jgi:lactoylglutathione lyase